MNQFLLSLKRNLEKMPWVAMIYRWSRDVYKLRSSLKMTPFGFKFAGNGDMVDGSFEPEESVVLQHLMDRSNVVINVGANQGYYTCMALNKGKYVVAVEPIIGNLKLLYKNVIGNGFQEKVEVYPIALSKSVGVRRIFGGGTDASLIDGWHGQKYFSVVPVLTLDILISGRFLDEKILYIVDVEGGEYEMLLGARGGLSLRDNSIWFIEIIAFEHLPKGVIVNQNMLKTFKLFEEYGYVAFAVKDGLKPIDISEIHQLMTSLVDTLNAHNFVFVSKEMSMSFAEKYSY